MHEFRKETSSPRFEEHKLGTHQADALLFYAPDHVYRCWLHKQRPYRRWLNGGDYHKCRMGTSKGSHWLRKLVQYPMLANLLEVGHPSWPDTTSWETGDRICERTSRCQWQGGLVDHFWHMGTLQIFNSPLRVGKCRHIVQCLTWKAYPQHDWNHCVYTALGHEIPFI